MTQYVLGTSKEQLELQQSKYSVDIPLQSGLLVSSDIELLCFRLLDCVEQEHFGQAVHSDHSDQQPPFYKK